MLASLILLTLNFLGTWYLETTLTAYYKFELLVVGLLLIFGVWIITAEMQRVKAAWRVSTVYFSLSILNLTFLFMVNGHFFVFGLTTVVALLGLLRSVGKIDELPDLPTRPVKLETYHARDGSPLYVDPVMWVHPDDLVSGDVKPSRVKTSRSAKKSTKKKSTGNKSKRKTGGKRKKNSRKKSTRKSTRKTTRKKSSRKKSSRRKSRRR